MMENTMRLLSLNLLIRAHIISSDLRKNSVNYFIQRLIFAFLWLDDKCSEAYLGSADAYINLGNKDKAIEIFRAGYNKTYNENIHFYCLNPRRLFGVNY